ncbi:MAG: hypothetical protein IPH74_11250 [Bacteroidetes bacterium]|nr:hypothetical protein [Bacteroidota bacterium]
MLSSCKKEENKPKQTRLKTYTHEYYERIPASLDKYTIEYNSANKISKVIYESNGVLYSTKYCVYTASNVLDSIIEKFATGGSSFYKIIWTGNKISKYGTTTLTYNSDGLVDKKTYLEGDYFRNEYKGDSVLLYFKDISVPEKISNRYKLSSTIKNPFLISGFEAEAYLTGILFYYNDASNALLPNIETTQIAYINGNLWYRRDYTFEGDFNGYPLKRNDLYKHFRCQQKQRNIYLRRILVVFCNYFLFYEIKG